MRFYLVLECKKILNTILMILPWYYENKKHKNAIFEITNEIISLFKNSTELKMALKIADYAPLVLEIDCRGFTKAYNETPFCE